jgi:hypothetical protein
MSNEYSALSNKSILSNGYYINIMTVIYMPMNMQWNLGNPKEMLPAFPTFAYDRSRISFFMLKSLHRVYSVFHAPKQ